MNIELLNKYKVIEGMYNFCISIMLLNEYKLLNKN